MKDDSQDPWKAYIQNVTVLSAPATIIKMPAKKPSRKPSPLNTFVEQCQIENVSRETFLKEPKKFMLQRRKIRNLKIERKLDLHGLTLKEAHQELCIFLWKASQQGIHTVLIITGKGLRRVPHLEQSEPRLRLKEALPQWLMDPPLSALVSLYAPARPEHGGEGAFYLFLKKKHRENIDE